MEKTEAKELLNGLAEKIYEILQKDPEADIHYTFETPKDESGDFEKVSFHVNREKFFNKKGRWACFEDGFWVPV